MLREERREESKQVEDRESEEVLGHPHRGLALARAVDAKRERQHSETAGARDGREGEPSEPERDGRQAERTEERADKSHSEFHYGSFVRTVPLPPKASEDEVTATYENGILEVRVPIAGAAPVGRDIPVEVPAVSAR